MKNILKLLLISPFIVNCYAMGPSEITFNGIKFVKNAEKRQNNNISAEYSPLNKNSAASLVVTHVMDKNEPTKIAKALKEKKSVEVVESEILNGDNSDVLVTFVKFDLPNLKVQNNLCRIIKSPSQGGSIVFQYIETNKLKSQTEGTTLPDFALMTDSIKQLPLDKYLTSMSEPMSRATRYVQQDNNNVPWYKRPNARAGAEYYSRGNVRNTSYYGR